MSRLNTLLLVVSIGFLLLLACDNNRGDTQQAVYESTSPVAMEFDSLTATRYGADEYGMKKYVMAFLKRGPNRDLDSLKRMELQMAHLENIGKMAEAGKLVLAGPFFGDGDLRGIYIFNVGSLKEAQELTNTDPAIQAGSLTMELKEWYGSAGLMAVNGIHKTLSRKDISGD